jgi:ParB family chromosome partitioning protein
MAQIRELPLDTVRPNPKQPRVIFTQPELEELAASIREHGLIQPIQVRAQGRHYLIVCGERRWRAHKLLGLKAIRAEVVVGMSNDELADRALIENLHRRDITPLEEARAFQARLDAGMTAEEVARRLGIKQPHRITDRTQLLCLLPEYQDALARGILSPSQATEMSCLQPAGQRRLFDAIGAGRCATYAELRKVTGALLDAENQRAMFPEDKPPSDEEIVRVRVLEQKIAKVCELVRDGFEEGDVVIAYRVNPLSAGVLAEKLLIIEKSLAELRLALHAQAAVASPSMASATAA